MKRTILAGILVWAAGASGLMAQKGNQNAAPAGQPKGPAPKSQAELTALQALFAAQQPCPPGTPATTPPTCGPDGVIAGAEAVLTKFADTDFKSTALFLEATAYQQKRDAEKAQLFAERALDADPKNFQASLMLAQSLAQATRENDLDKEEKLTKADKYANQTIATLNVAAKPNPQITDQQWEDAKKDLTAQAHDAMGMADLTRKKYDAAVTEFKTAIDGAAHPEPASKVRLASAYQNMGKYDESIATAESVMNDALVPQQIRQVAQSIRAGSVVAKNKAAGQGASTPAAPSQVEIKKQ